MNTKERREKTDESQPRPRKLRLTKETLKDRYQVRVRAASRVASEPTTTPCTRLAEVRNTPPGMRAAGHVSSRTTSPCRAHLQSSQPVDWPPPDHLGPHMSAGFFVLRTPLLPLSAAIALSDGLEAPRAIDCPALLEGALSRDRALVRARLRACVETPAIREAIFVASPDLDQAIDHWLRTPESDRGAAAERSLMRYVVRMAARATPFGLFAGSAVGTIGQTTQLAVGSQADCRRHTRLDMDYLVLLAEGLAREPTLTPAIRYTPNSSLYRSADRWRYVETRLQGKSRSHHLVALDDSDALTATIERAREGAIRNGLAAALVDDEVSEEEADTFVGELIEGQILVPDVECPITGAEPLAHLEGIARRRSESSAIADRLAAIARGLNAIDAAGVGVGPASYHEIAARLAELPAKTDLTRLFQVDLVKPASAATLGRDVFDEIVRGIEILRRLSPAVDQDDSLARFRAAFAERYEERMVPLVEALDEEAGVGAALVGGADRDASPLLRGLDFPDLQPKITPWDRREIGLLSRVGNALLAGRHEMPLTPKDIDELAYREMPPLPDAFSVVATLVAGGSTPATDSDFRVLIYYAGGPSGARLLGRFCHADPALRAHVEQHLRDEEALEPDALFAEIAHLPEGRLGNILLRPVQREYEIPYLGRSGAPAERQLPVTDLVVGLVEGRFELRSLRLGRRIVPRLTSAHNFRQQSLAVYRFLCLLQSEGRLGSWGWTWGSLTALPFLPRVTCGRLVFARAAWRVTGEEIRTLSTAPDAKRYAEVQSWRAARCLPRWVVLADYDHTLPVDLDNVLAVDAFVPLLKGREFAMLLEMYPGPEELCAVGADGRYVHELILPFSGHTAGMEAAKTEVVRAGTEVGGRRLRGQSNALLARYRFGGRSLRDPNGFTPSSTPERGRPIGSSSK